MKSVLIRAPLLSVSGYGVHSRCIYRWLESREDFDITSQVLNWGNTTWMINQELEDGLVGRIMSTTKPLNKKFDMTFQVQLPDEWDPTLGSFNVGISAFVETDRCNPAWLECCNKMDLVIVPSNHIRDCIIRTGNVKTPIKVVAEAFSRDLLFSKEKVNLDLETKFNFLMVSQLTSHNPSEDRKNIFNTIKWFCDVFKGNKEVGLIVKTNSGRSTRFDRHITKNSLTKIINECREGAYPKVYLVHGMLSSGEMGSLYKDDRVKCLVSLTKGEGFGLPIMESAVCGLPVMATAWSGHLDILSESQLIPIDFTLENIPPNRVDNRIFVNGLKWAHAIERDFKLKLVDFVKNEKKYKRKAKDLSLKKRSIFSQQNIEKHLNNILEEF